MVSRLLATAALIHDIKTTGQIVINVNDEFIDVQKAKLLKQKKEEGNTAFKNSQLEEAYKLYRLISQNEETSINHVAGGLRGSRSFCLL